MGFQEGLPLGVGSAAQRIGVPCGPVGLQDELSLRPAEVWNHDPAGKRERLVHFGGLEATCGDHVEHYFFQLRPRRSRKRKDVAQHSGSAYRSQAIEEHENAGHAHKPEPQGLPERVADPGRIEHGCECDHGPSRLGNEDSSAQEAVRAGDQTRAVDLNAVMSMIDAIPDGDLDVVRSPWTDGVFGCAGSMAQGCIWTTRLRRRDKPSLERHAGMSDRIDAFVQPVQPSVTSAARDRASIQADRPELVVVEHPLGVGCESRHRPVAVATNRKAASPSRIVAEFSLEPARHIASLSA